MDQKKTILLGFEGRQADGFSEVRVRVRDYRQCDPCPRVPGIVCYEEFLILAAGDPSIRWRNKDEVVRRWAVLSWRPGLPAVHGPQHLTGARISRTGGNVQHFPPVLCVDKVEPTRTGEAVSILKPFLRKRVYPTAPVSQTSSLQNWRWTQARSNCCRQICRCRRNN